MRGWLALLLLGALALAGLYAGLHGLAIFDPPRRGLVADEAQLLGKEDEERLREFHALLLTDFDIDYAVVTEAATDDIDGAALARFEALAAESPSRQGRMLLLLVDPKADRVRVEVGYALEGVFPDAFVAYLESRQMVPFFRAGRVADGILATTEMIIARAQRAKASEAFDPSTQRAASGGGGASVAARLGQKAAPKRHDREARATAAPGDTPEKTVAAYVAVMAARNSDPDLPLYTPETRAMLAGWVVTPAQMDNVVRDHRRCPSGATTYSRDRRRAVIHYPVAARTCAPWFLRREGNRWLLDLTMMQQAVRFGRSNAWRLVPGIAHPYRFAFADWRFDANGFPHRRR